MTAAANTLAADLARQLGRLRWHVYRPSGWPGYRWVPASLPQSAARYNGSQQAAFEGVGLRGVWHPDFATGIYDKMYTGFTVSLTGFWTAGAGLGPKVHWASAAEMAEAIREVDPTLIGYGPDAWLAHFGGKMDPAASCIFAHVLWYFARQKMGDWAVGAIRSPRYSRQAVMGGVADPEFDPRSAMTVLRLPLRSYERGVVANDPSPIKVDDLDWYLAGLKPLLDKMRAAKRLPDGELVPDFTLRAYGDCMRSGGDLFCSEPPGPYLMSWVMAAQYFAKVTIPGNLAEQWAWGAWDLFVKSNQAGFSSTSVDMAIVNSIMTAFVVTAQHMIDRINAESTDISNLAIAALTADGQHGLFNTARAQAREAAAKVKGVTDFLASALPAIQASGNDEALHLLTLAQQNVSAADAAVSRFDTTAAVTYASNAHAYAVSAADAAGNAIAGDDRRKLQVEKATTALKYLLVGGGGLAALVLAWLAFKE